MNRAIKNIILTICALLCSQIAWSQTVKVAGKVMDAASQPLPGAAVMIQGSLQGVQADIDGNYAIEADSKAVLEVSFIGYQTRRIPVNGRSRLDIILQEDENLLDETVVVGYGTQKKVNLTGSVAMTDYSEIAKSRPITSTSAALSGMNAGVMIRQTSSMPGQESVNIRIRGTGTLNTASPLIIVDGFEGAIDNVNPDDIATISVLKDAASCAIYGNRGANGVVLITTKSGGKPSDGEKGVFHVTYSGQYALSTPANKFKLVSSYADYMQIMNESAENIDAPAVFSQAMIDLWREKAKDPYGIADSGYPNYVAYPNVDWIDAMFEYNIFQKHNISATGTMGGTKYLISASYLDNPGILENTGYKRYQLRTNVSSQINKWLKIGVKLWGFYGSREANDYAGSSTYMARAVPCIYPYYDGKYGWMENPEQNANSRNNLYFFNMVDGSMNTLYANAATFINIRLPFDIKYNVSFNYNTEIVDFMRWVTRQTAYSFSKGAVAYENMNLSQQWTTVQFNTNAHWTFQTNFSYDHTFAGRHNVTGLVGFEALKNVSGTTQSRRTGTTNKDLHELNTISNMSFITGTHSSYAAASVFGRATYAYEGKYLAEVNLRYDGSSRFASRSRWGLFPSVSAGWRLSQENWMKDSHIDNLKLRASWGKLGNNSIGNYDYISTYDTGYYYPIGSGQQSGIVATLSNNLLEWETTTSYDAGVDLGVLNNRLTFEGDVYLKVTDGILYKAPVYATIGAKEAPYQNLCEVTNRGFETTLKWKDDIGSFHYGISANFTRNWNVVSKYKGRLEAGWRTDEKGRRVYESNIGDVSTGTSQRVMEGKTINEWYLAPVYSGDGSHFFADGSVNPKGGPGDGMIRTPEDMAWLEAMVAAGAEFLPNKGVSKKEIWYGDYIYADVNGDGVYGGSSDYQFTGKSITPKFYYGVQMDMLWKGVDLSLTLSGQGGGAMYWRYNGFNSYGTNSMLVLAYDIAYDHYFYDPANPDDPRTNTTSKHARLTLNSGSEQSGSSVTSTHFYYNLDFLRVKNLTLGYTLPSKWMKKVGVYNMRVYLSGENLFTFTDYPGMDPEFASTTNYYAMLRQYTAGINLTF